MTTTAAVFRIFYRSNSTKKLGDPKDGVFQIIRTANTFNASAGITGALMLHKDKFAQILEGPEAEVLNLYGKISADDRHKNVTLLRSERGVPRLFADWHMALISGNGFADVPLTATKNTLSRAFPRDLDAQQTKLTDYLRNSVLT